MHFDYRRLEEDFIPEVADELLDLYEKHVKRYHNEKGDHTFRTFISPKAIAKRLQKGSHFFVVFDGDEWIGGLELEKDQLHQLFVRESHRGKGYSRMLIDWLKSFVKEHNIAKSIWVDATPNSYQAYDKLGFKPESAEREKGGMIRKKMVLKL